MVRTFLGGSLAGKLTSDEMGKLTKSIDIVGDVAIVKVPPELETKKQIISEAVMTVNRNIRTVLNQAGPTIGEFRLRSLEWIAGERKIETIYREYGCVFKVNLFETYFSPRLSFERMRIARLVKEGETVVNMFAGVGCFSIVIGKKSKACRVYSIDINPKAVELMQKNIVLNRLEDKVEATRGDAREVVEGRFRETSNRVLMPLPAKAYEYLDAACAALKPEGGFIHYYDFIHARKNEDAMVKIADKVKKKLIFLGKDFEIPLSRIVRTVGPNWYQVVLDLEVH
ncbi:MAG: class I SAM-dependent methyltransferase family protein [Candidatus Bathyarchaeota archaeon]